MVGRWILLFATVIGCDWTVGVHYFEPDLGKVTGTYQLHWIENDVNGGPVPMSGALAPADVTATVVLDDGQPRTVTLDDAGVFSFTTATVGQRYALELVTPSGDTVYDLDATTPAIVERYAGRIDRSLVPNGTGLLLTVTGHPPNTIDTKEELHATGVWNKRRAISESGTVYKIDWTKFEGLGGPMGLLDGSRHDALFYAHYGPDPAGYVRLDSFATKPDATITNLAMNAYTIAAQPVAPDRCTHVVADTAMEASRLIAVHPGSNAVVEWAINAHPTDEFASYARYPLAYADIVPAVGLDVTASYHNPYIKHLDDAELTVAIGYNNTISVIDTITPISSACPATTTIPTGAVVIPTDLALDGVSLFDNPSATYKIDRTTPVLVTWNASDSGAADIYIVSLQEVIDPTDGFDPRVRTIVSVFTTRHSATIDPFHFSSTPTYKITVTAFVGYPDAGAGDFTNLLDVVSGAAASSIQFRVR